MLKVFLIISLMVFFLDARSQERCGTVLYEKLRDLRNPDRETIDQFENWIKRVTSRNDFKTERAQEVTYVIPVVVHIIHNGEPVGTGRNIPEAQILSQLTVLNDDFERLNADTIYTPSEFKASAGKMRIAFVMAKQDPNGLATNGILRVKGSQKLWDISDNYTLKALSYWPAENYLNIWVADLVGG
jgi:hypothetical protein